MGTRDTEEMLEAAQAQAVLDERTITAQAAQLDAIRAHCDEQTARWAGLVGAAAAAVPVTALRAILDRTPKGTP